MENHVVVGHILRVCGGCGSQHDVEIGTFVGDLGLYASILKTLEIRSGSISCEFLAFLAFLAFFTFSASCPISKRWCHQ